MDGWVAIGVFLLGAGSGALLTLIARTGLRARRASSIEEAPICPDSRREDCEVAGAGRCCAGQ